MRVSVSGRQFKFPRECACCGAYALVTLTVTAGEKNRLSRTRGWVFEVPYCVACRKHIRRVEALLTGALALAAGSIIAGVLWTLSSGDWRHGLAVLITGLIGGGVVALVLLQLIRRTLTRSCIHITRSVTYLGANGPCHTFDIRSPFYFAEFVRANHRKLVNASPRVVSVLNGTRFGDFQVPRRVLRTRR